MPAPRRNKNCNDYINHGHHLLKNETIAYLSTPLSANWYTQTALADVTLQAIADFVGTDRAF